MPPPEEALKAELRKTFADFDIREIDLSILNTILGKTESNALLALQFTRSLIKSNHVKNLKGVMMASEEFERYNILDDWSFIETPDLALKLNSMKIDQLQRITSE